MFGIAWASTLIEGSRYPQWRYKCGRKNFRKRVFILNLDLILSCGSSGETVIMLRTEPLRQE